MRAPLQTSNADSWVHFLGERRETVQVIRFSSLSEGRICLIFFVVFVVRGVTCLLNYYNFFSVFLMSNCARLFQWRRGWKWKVGRPCHLWGKIQMINCIWVIKTLGQNDLNSTYVLKVFTLDNNMTIDTELFISAPCVQLQLLTDLFIHYWFTTATFKMNITVSSANTSVFISFCSSSDKRLESLSRSVWSMLKIHYLSQTY